MKFIVGKLLTLMLGVLGGVLTIYMYRCWSFTWALDGVVSDQATGAPVPNAIVVSSLPTLTGFIFNVNRDHVYIRETLTNEKGEFHIPAWGPRLYFTRFVLSGEPQILITRDDYKTLVIRGLPREKINSVHGAVLPNQSNDYLRLTLKTVSKPNDDPYWMPNLLGFTYDFNSYGNNKCWQKKTPFLTSYMIKNNLFTQKYIDSLTLEYCEM
jgi:hypothetical protein